MFNFLKKLIMGNNININGKIYENGNSIVIELDDELKTSISVEKID